MLALVLSGCVVPLPHRRVHAFGVAGRVLDFQSRSPVKAARIEAADDRTKVAFSDARGSFMLPPVSGWHGAYFIGPIGLSLFPALDMPSMSRAIAISANGYRSVTIPFESRSTRNPYIQAGDILLEPK